MSVILFDEEKQFPGLVNEGGWRLDEQCAPRNSIMKINQTAYATDEHKIQRWEQRATEHYQLPTRKTWTSRGQ